MGVELVDGAGILFYCVMALGVLCGGAVMH